MNINPHIIMLNALFDNEKKGYNSFKDYSLKNIINLLSHLGNPQNNLKAVHIAGTNGKGSVCYMLNSILLKAGYKVGLYTSPHFLKINERIKISNKDIKTTRLNKYIDDLSAMLKKNKDLNPTYFDALTLIAFRYFSDENTDICIIETGLGGRLDSTNVLKPIISLITDIGYDHTHILGKTIRDIAHEKAGIIKSGSIAITSNNKANILKILSKAAEKHKTELYVLNKNFYTENIIKQDTGFVFDYAEQHNGNAEDKYIIKQININNPCGFQIKNAALAVSAAKLLNKSGFIINHRHIRTGIAGAVIPGRLETMSKTPLIIYDPAHNPDALKAMINTLKSLYPEKKYICLISFMKDKNYKHMIQYIKKSFTREILYYELDDERCMKISDILNIKSGFNGIKVFDNFNSLHNNLLNILSQNTLLFITGSFRLYKTAGELSQCLRK